VVLPVVLPGVLLVVLPAEPVLLLMSVGAADGVAGVPAAPMEVPLPVLVSVLGVLGVDEPLAVVLLVESLGGVVVVEGSVLDVEVEVDVSVDDVAASSFLPQALRDRAAIRARAAHCAIGDLIIRNSLWVSVRSESRVATARFAACGSL
jgi:hypothetical protein